MFSRLMPREARFFNFFRDHAEQIVLAARELRNLMDFKDLEHRVYNIESIEKRADKITRAAIDLLHKTFITPLDREDIHRLITCMDDVIDLIEDAAQSFLMYDIRSVTPEAVRLAEICVGCGEKVRGAVDLLQTSRNLPQVMALCQDIDRLESEADHVMRDAMAKLFRDQPDVRELIKFRAIYELMEAVTDRCEDVANIIEGIAIENS
ncbi:MAG: phosphate transport regulator [Betaproteobacteria bacterium RIFCSPLOWO2_02_FULL_65_24]|nr:MAG: phosphate transport regulator [Betaproteobacteria bacterium RIFCSPLOWO2_02_FULL_65_24]OGA32279.1 MAG: phosphate transport regulator [Betaproteobacteria bacterium RIFCSPLOWO2_12_FULL_62_13b]